MWTLVTTQLENDFWSEAQNLYAPTPDQPGECSGDIFLAQGISCQLSLMFSNKGVEKLQTLNYSYSMGKESPIQRLSYKLVDRFTS